MTNPNTSRTARATITNPSGLLQLKFLRITTDVMKQERIACKSDIISMKQELALLEDARLHIRKKDDKRYFTCIPKDKTNELPITQDPDRVLELARREYLEKEIKISEKRLKWLDRIADSAECAKEEQRLLARLQRFDDAHLDLCRILFTKKILIILSTGINEDYLPRLHLLTVKPVYYLDKFFIRSVNRDHNICSKHFNKRFY